VGVLLSVNAVAETVYVTDELRLGLYESELTNGRQFKTLVSGAALEVLERSLMSIRVRTEDGDEGWVKSAYIVTEEPGRRRAARLEERNAELEAAQESALTELNIAESRIAELEAELSSAVSGIEALPGLRSENADLESELAARGEMVSLRWLLIAVAAALVFGAVAGYYWLDRKVRKQFGGVRVY